MDELRSKIISSLEDQGFCLNGAIELQTKEKSVYKHLHISAKSQSIKLHSEFLNTNYKKIYPFLRNGADINPSKIDLEIREVKTGSLESIIFKWWNLVWWSVPYQRPYGRQMRFILWDKGHDAPFGLIGLQSPILKMAVRDKALSIPNESLDFWVNQSMQAQRLGALPPYNDLLGGKMVALSVTSNEIRSKYKLKYQGQLTILKNRVLSSDLLFVTTTSAFGRSSIYNRLKYNNDLVAQSLGFTKGAGSFHIPEDLYKEILSFLSSKGVDTRRSFGTGPSRRLKLLYLGFKALGLPDFTFHNIEREFFVFSYVSNLNKVINDGESPIFHNRTIEELQDYWSRRWALPRTVNRPDWNLFNCHKYVEDFSIKYQLNFTHEYSDSNVAGA